MPNSWNFPSGLSDTTSVSYADMVQLFQPVPTASPTQPQSGSAGAQPQLAQASAQTTASEFTGRPGTYYFETATYAAHFEIRRSQKLQYIKQHRPNLPYWTEADEMQLVNNLHVDWYSEPWQSMDWDYPVLDLDKLEARPLRKRELRPFKLSYDTYAECRLRLANTCIAIKGHPFVVQKVRKASNGVKDFVLAVTNRNHEKFHQVKLSDLIDLRSIPPMYINHQGGGYWLMRIPGKVYQQGLNRHNAVFGTVDGNGFGAAADPVSIMQAVDRRDKRVPWSPVLQKLMENGALSSTRLSDEIAVKPDEKGEIIACYRGRSLGTIRENDVIVSDEDDLLQDWIINAAKNVELKLRP